VGSIMAGKVLHTSASSVLVGHAHQRRSAYLHLDSVKVQSGEQVEAGQVIGTVGDANAKDVHLHLTYMIGPKRYIDEFDSRNPLEILPHPEPAEPVAKLDKGSIVLTLETGMMTVNQIDLICQDGTELSLNYLEVVSLGKEKWSEQVQSGIHIAAGRPRKNKDDIRVFDLTLAPTDARLIVRKVVLTDYRGEHWWEASFND